ncbi:MAG: ABC transporter substrate-binding protein [Magnetococcales bacterium]|nr:ABC transporter substrate-binding protein [Magnetococcales bacterium]
MKISRLLSPIHISMTIAALFLCVSMGSQDADAESISATTAIRATIDKTVGILQDVELAKEENLAKRRELLRQTIFTRFDFDRMSRGAIGRAWRKFSPDQKKRFTELFKQVLETSYMDKVEGYQGESVEFTKEVKIGRTVRVDSVVQSKGQEYALSYRMLHSNGEWRVFDVIIEGISLIANYRPQFKQILQRGNVEGLLEKLKMKINQTSKNPMNKSEVKA